MTVRRLALIKHLEAKHEDDLKLERYGLFGAARRMENLCRVRVMGRARFEPYFKLLKQFDLNEVQRAQLRSWSRMVLAEANCLLGDEDCAAETHIEDLTGHFNDMQ